MKEVVKLMDYRPDIKIVDATLRDGGLASVMSSALTSSCSEMSSLTLSNTIVYTLQINYKFLPETFHDILYNIQHKYSSPGMNFFQRNFYKIIQ